MPRIRATPTVTSFGDCGNSVPMKPANVDDTRRSRTTGSRFECPPDRPDARLDAPPARRPDRRMSRRDLRPAPPLGPEPHDQGGVHPAHHDGASHGLLHTEHPHHPGRRRSVQPRDVPGHPKNPDSRRECAPVFRKGTGSASRGRRHLLWGPEKVLPIRVVGGDNTLATGTSIASSRRRGGYGFAVPPCGSRGRRCL